MKKLQTLTLLVLSVFLVSANPPGKQEIFYSPLFARTTSYGPHIDDVDYEETFEAFEFQTDKLQIIHHLPDGDIDTLLVYPFHEETFTIDDTGIYFLPMNFYNLNTEVYGKLVLEYYPYGLGVNSVLKHINKVYTKWLLHNDKIRQFYEEVVKPEGF